MQAVILAGFVVMAVGATLFFVPRMLPFRGRTARSLTRLAVAAWLLAILLIVATVAIGLIGHVLLLACSCSRDRCALSGTDLHHEWR